jgi:MFS family permease
MVYIGLSCASLFGSFIFHKISANYIIAVMVILNAVACYVFVLVNDILVLYAIRFALGFTQAFVVIHGPVWINEFSPQESSAKWLAMLHGAVVIGILGGYIITAIFENYF